MKNKRKIRSNKEMKKIMKEYPDLFKDINMSDFDIPDFDWKNARRITPEEHARFKRALDNTFGKERPIKIGRPKKEVLEKFIPVSIRLHPKILKWAKAEAKKKKVGYQTIINDILLKIAA